MALSHSFPMYMAMPVAVQDGYYVYSNWIKSSFSFRLDSPALVVFYDLSNHQFGALAILYVDASFSLVAIQSYQLTKSILCKLFITGVFMYMYMYVHYI